LINFDLAMCKRGNDEKARSDLVVCTRDYMLLLVNLGSVWVCNFKKCDFKMKILKYAI